MADETTERVAPQDDPSFLSASPEDRHAYLMATDPSYASASPEDQKAYSQHQVLEGAKVNAAKPVNVPQENKGWIDTANQAFASNPNDSTLTRVGNALGRVAMAPVNMAREAVRPVSEEEKKEGFTGDALDYMGPIQAYRMAVKPAVEANKRIDTMAAAQEAREKAGTAKYPSMVRKAATTAGHVLADVPFVGPLALGLGEQAEKGDVAGTALETLAYGAGPEALHEVPKEFPTVKAAATPLVKGAGRAIERASTPAVALPAAGIALGSHGGPIGVGIGGAIGGGLAATFERPTEPLIKVPSMTRFGEKPEVTPRATETVPIEKGAAGPLEQRESKLEPLQKEFDKATEEFNKAHAAREAYRASMDQGIAPPAKIQKAFEKAQSALDEAQYHLQTAMEAQSAAGQAEPIRQQLAPAKAAAGEYGAGEMQPPAQDIREKLVPAKEAAGEFTAPPARPEPRPASDFAREEINPPVKDQPIEMPRMQRSGPVELANQGGVMGRPLQLKGQVGDASAFDAADQIREGLVPAKDNAKAYEAESPEVERMRKMGETADQVKRIGELTREGLGGTELQRGVPLREQVEKPVGEIIPPEKRTPYEPPAEAQQAWKSAEKYLGENPFEEPVEGQVKTEPKTIEGEVSGHAKNQVRANGEALANAIPTTPEGKALLQKLHDLSNVELRQLAINAGEDMGQQAIGRGKASGNVSRPELFERLLKNHTPQELGDMVDDGKHLPTVSGGSQGATAELPKPNTKEAADLDTDLFRRAKEALGPDASMSDVAKTAQAMKQEIYSGPERRVTPRTNPLSPKELEEAMAQRRPTTTPFDVTEGAKKTIEADKNMPQHASKENTNVTKGANDFNKANDRPELQDTRANKPDENVAKIADAYEEMKHDPENPEVKKSYAALIDDIKKQWNFATKKMGIKIEPTEADPYGFTGDKPAEEQLFDDVKNNKRLKVFTGGNPLPEDHPLAAVDPKTGETYNTMFRAVHDLFGHIAQGNDFSETGEENAWRAHKQMMSPDAVPAMTTETRGQTSWFFNNGEVRGGEPVGKFADQKAGILPDFAMHETEKVNKVLGDIKNNKDFAVLTAENPDNQRISPEENLKRNNELMAELRKEGYHPEPVQGHNKDVQGEKENSFYVPDMKPEDAAKFGKKYGQAAVLTREGLHDLNTDKINPSYNRGVLTGADAEKQPYYSTVGGQPFSVPIDFDKSLTREQMDAGEGLRSVSGGKIAKAEAEALAEKHMVEGEQFGTEAGRKNFIKNLMQMPSVQEVTDIAKAGEIGKTWYQRSTKAFDALMKVAPKYFQEADRDKFLNFLASLSPQQSVKMNMQEALHTWSKWVDMGKPDGKKLESLLRGELTISDAKTNNAMKALAGEQMWPDLSNNRNFKVPSFAENLRGFLHRVTNDGWQAAFAGLVPEKMQTAAQYHPLSVITRAAADALGWEPAEAQAAIWAFTKMLTEKGEKLPESVLKYSEDFADLMAHDTDIRQQLNELGVDLGELDGHLKQIERKPEVTAGASPTTEDSVRKLSKRIEAQRGKLPQPKDSGLFDFTDAEERNRFFKPREDESTSFEFGENATPKMNRKKR